MTYSKKYLTQKELADRYNTSVNTIKNWREKGYLPCMRLPGCSRILYPLEDIIDVEQTFTKPAKEVKNKKQPSEIKRKKPVISPTDKEWRI